MPAEQRKQEASDVSGGVRFVQSFQSGPSQTMWEFYSYLTNETICLPIDRTISSHGVLHSNTIKNAFYLEEKRYGRGCYVFCVPKKKELAPADLKALEPVLTKLTAKYTGAPGQPALKITGWQAACQAG